jgi:malate synthase
VAQLQTILDAPPQEVDVKDKSVPTVTSGFVKTERLLMQSCGLLNSQGKITPWVVTEDMFSKPEKLFAQELWDNIYGVPKGEITIEHIQHAFYMATNYGFQILDGNFAAAIDDYELSLRFMNDLATYRIDVSWLWTLQHHQAVITQNGYLKRPSLTEDGLTPAEDAFEVKAGTPFNEELFQRLWDYHNEWTSEFFAELDRLGNPGRFDRNKAPVIMEILKRQLLSPRYVQHSARVLFVLAPANEQERLQLLEAIFTLSREEVAKRVHEGTLNKSALDAHDYIHDIFPGVEGE